MSAPVLISAGGTGGHVFPALAVAEILRRRGVDIVWLGTEQGIEGRVVPEAGFNTEWISVNKLRGKGLIRKLLLPVQLSRSILQVWKVFSRYRPGAVLGMGGYTAAPAGIVAVMRRLPLVIHEQNSIPGMTNRLLSRFARRVYTAFPAVFKTVVSEIMIGNPVRASIANITSPAERVPHTDACRVLVIGGSQGARRLNQVVPEALARSGQPFTVRHQCGFNDQQMVQQAYQQIQVTTESGVVATVSAFIDDMAEAYAWADLVIARAGAMTIAELTAAGVGSILVPYPYAVDDHQRLNAQWLQQHGAAEILLESELTSDVLAQHLDRLAGDPHQRLAMASSARSLYQEDAAEKLADAMQSLLAGESVHGS